MAILSNIVTASRRTWGAFWQPEMPDERTAAAAVWDQLPAELKTDAQALGRHSAGCSATYGVMEACDFKCTACYLADDANNTPPLPFEEVKAQLDAIRAHLGPWGNTQITAGEVTLLPCDDLVRILQYCQKIQLSPMLMTNGQTILKDPKYLERLVTEGGLDKISIHIDTTQKGRLGLRPKDTETDIQWMRDAFANLIRQTRKKTGKYLSAATTYTVTENNFDSIPKVMEWCIDNADAFRMISFQPTADVGRTRDREQVQQQASLWSKICSGVKQDLNPHTFLFGHPKCNQVCLMFVVSFDSGHGMERHIMQVSRPESDEDHRFFERLLNGGFAGFCPDGEEKYVVLSRIFGRLRQKPMRAWDISSFCAKRVWQERKWLPRLLKAISRGRRWSIDPFVVIIHNFMSSHELETQEGKQRLQACSFKVPVDGRMVSMCELNGTDLRRTLNERDQDRLIQIATPIRRAS